MTLTVKGGKSPRQNAAIRGRELIRKQQREKKAFEKLREEGNQPSLEIGPLLNNTRRS